MPAGPQPRFFVAIMPARLRAPQDATDLEAFSSATGRVVGRLAPPEPGRYFLAVAALGNDRTFVAAASRTHGVCGTWLYRFSLTPQGKPTALAPLSVPEVAGDASIGESGQLAASADGNVIAYDTISCTQTKTSVARDYGQVGVINLSSGKETTWQYKFPATPADLSLSADGSLLSFVSDPSNGTREASSAFNSAWVLRTDAAPGQLARSYRKVVPEPPRNDELSGAALSPTGAVMYVTTAWYLGGTSWRLSLGAYQTATGALIRLLRPFPRLDGVSGVSINPDISGRYLLVVQWTDRLEMLDLVTGHLSKVPGTASGASSATEAFGAAW
jgi:hypothetical protein